MFIDQDILGQKYDFFTNIRTGNRVCSDTRSNDDNRMSVLQSSIKFLEIILIENQENAMQMIIDNLNLSKLVKIMTEIYTNIIRNNQNQIISNVKQYEELHPNIDIGFNIFIIFQFFIDIKDKDRERVVDNDDLKKLKLIKHQKYEEVMKSQLDEKEQN